MPTKHVDIEEFKNISLVGGNSLIGSGYQSTWTLSNLTRNTTFDASTQQVQVVASAVATMIYDLSNKGLL